MAKGKATPRHPCFRHSQAQHCRPWQVGVIAGLILLWSSVCRAQIGSPWSKPIDITQPSDTERGIFGILLCDPYQNVHLLWADLSQQGAAIFYRNDINGTWSPPTDVLVVSEPVIIELRAAIAPQDNTLHVIWRNQWAIGALYHSQVPLAKADTPRDWAPPTLLADSGVTDARIQVDPAGVIHVLYGLTNSAGTQNLVLHIKSEDDGESWSDPTTVTSLISDQPSVIHVNAAIDEAGRIHVGVSLRPQEYGGYSEVGYVYSADGGQTWGDYRQIEKLGLTFQGVEKIAPYTFGENEIHLTWHDPRRMHQWSSDGGQTWSNPVEIMPLGAAFGGENQLVKDSGGTIHVVTAVGDGVFSAEWRAGRWGAPEPIDNRAIDPHGQNIIVCQGNRLHVVYYDRTGPERVWYATRQVNAPHIARRPLPLPTASPPVSNPTPTPPLPGTAEPTAAIARGAEGYQPDSGATSGLSGSLVPVLVAGAAVFVLIAGTAVVRQKLR